jgi:hypothetical protein
MAKIHGINNVPNPGQIKNIKKLVINLLQPLRDKTGCPVHINSGYRNKVLNALVGGVYNSKHTKGQAADIISSCVPLKELFLLIINEFDYDKVIYEFGEWIHVSYVEGANRKIALTAEKIHGETHYEVFTGSFPESHVKIKKEV